MTKKDAQARAQQLHEVIDDLRYRYHVLDDPEVTDELYDSLTRELVALEKQFPSIASTHSPTQRIGGKPLDKFTKVKHAVAQWSFHDAFTEQEVVDWETRILKMLTKALGHKPDDVSYVAELKIDGLHIVLTYEGGRLITAATRGDGKVGEDVTSNIKTIHSIPLVLREPVDMVIEGEVWLPEKELARINTEREKDGKLAFANPRNAAAGAIRQLDPAVAASRKLDAYLYDISGGDDLPDSQEEELARLKQLGCKVNTHSKMCSTIDQVLAFWRKWEPKRKAQPYWIDGIVVKVNQREYQEALGFTGKAPRWALAIKFAAEQATTVLQHVEWQVGRTGALTPRATFTPVQIAGTTVTHATLHNADEIARLGVKVGDTVVIEKAGDIIPKVINVLPQLRNGKEIPIVVPKTCPACDGPVTRSDDEVALYCANADCFAQTVERLTHFVSKKGFDIEGLGEKIVLLLVEQGIVVEPADFFTLVPGDLLGLEGFAQVSADNLVAAVAQKTNIELWRFINALGIRFVGEETSRLLAQRFGSFEGVRQASYDDLIAIDGVGEKVANGLVEYFADTEKQGMIDRLYAAGVMPFHEAQRSHGFFAGKSVVFTGTLQQMTREQAQDLVRAQGGNIMKSVSKKTDFVVTGGRAGSKLAKAKQLGVRILTEQEFSGAL